MIKFIIIFRKENIKSDCQQFHQYQHTEQLLPLTEQLLPLISNHSTQKALQTNVLWTGT